jgi:ATP-dependent DNA ligase
MEYIFRALAGTTSRLEKEAILKKHSDEPNLKRALFLALDPYTQFFIRRIPPYKTGVIKSKITLEQALTELEKLSSRQLTGNAAFQHLHWILESLTAEDAYVIERIIEKDLRCGVSDATVNKIFPGLIPTYPVMLASGYEERLMDAMKYPAMAQLKLDGMRFNAIVENGKVTFRSRNGKIIDLLGNLEEEFQKLAREISSTTKTPNVVFDGELIVKDNSGIMNRQKGNGILNKAVKGTIKDAEAALVHATIWDVIPLESFKIGFYNKYYKERFEMLESLDWYPIDKISLITTQTVKSKEEAQQVFQEYFSRGEEGIILKDSWGLWEDKRTKTQIKFKGELECDLLCVDWQEGTGKNVGKLGALVLESSDSLVKVNVGSGFTDEQRDKYTRENTVGKIVAVKYNARIQDKKTLQHSLFLPVFLELREDKDHADSASSIK